jgi:hypothetical protein
MSRSTGLPVTTPTGVYFAGSVPTLPPTLPGFHPGNLPANYSATPMPQHRVPVFETMAWNTPMATLAASARAYVEFRAGPYGK